MRNFVKKNGLYNKRENGGAVQVHRAAVQILNISKIQASDDPNW
jgi:hypothetical protein